MNIAINGFGRIGRLALRAALKKRVSVVAVNDLTDNNTCMHLLKHDSVHGKLREKVWIEGDYMHVANQKIRLLSEPDPEKLPWKKLGVDIVLECTGRFRKLEEAKKHLIAGAKKVVLSAPPKSEEIKQFVLGVNHDKLDQEKDIVISNSSCTTNSLAPIVKVLDNAFGIKKGFLTTIHGYTSSQKLVDGPHKDLRRARAAAINIIPTTTGAATAVTKVLPHLKGKLDGIALRVPTPSGSISDFTVLLKKEVSKEQVNNEFKKAAEGYLKGILEYSQEPLVSTDIIGNPHTSVFDAGLTKTNGRLVKVFSWYDNEFGYATKLVELAILAGGN